MFILNTLLVMCEVLVGNGSLQLFFEGVSLSFKVRDLSHGHIDLHLNVHLCASASKRLEMCMTRLHGMAMQLQ